jgi:hypothetical protein
VAKKKLNFYFIKYFLLFYKMLLTDLLKLFENTFNINEERFISIVESNNIKLNQRLLFEVNDKKKINNTTNKNNEVIINETISNTINSTINANTKEEVVEPNLKKKETSGRGRGRPRKTCEVKEESVLMEVEIIEIGGVEYYKTNENVILNKDLEIEGILKNGKIVR